ncbi:MAG: hypothetical protein JHC33_06675, partial [Ignisphaera sp.]|nr:hypothetical protein [Ignisphaera sp.]
RVFAVKRRVKPVLRDPPAEGSPEISEKDVFFDGWVKAAVYRRDQLPLGYKITGPAIIVEDYSTIVIPPKWEARVGKFGVIEVRR